MGRYTESSITNISSQLSKIMARINRSVNFTRLTTYIDDIMPKRVNHNLIESRDP